MGDFVNNTPPICCCNNNKRCFCCWTDNAVRHPASESCYCVPNFVMMTNKAIPSRYDDDDDNDTQDCPCCFCADSLSCFLWLFFQLLLQRIDRLHDFFFDYYYKGLITSTTMIVTIRFSIACHHLTTFLGPLIALVDVLLFLFP